MSRKMAPSGYPGKREEDHSSVSRFPSPDFVLDGISALVDNSLLRLEPGSAGEPRYQMLETVREYAAERLAESGEAAAVGRRHAALYLSLVERETPDVFLHAEPAWLYRLARDHDNIRAAFDWFPRPPMPMGASALPAPVRLIGMRAATSWKPDPAWPGRSPSRTGAHGRAGRVLSWAGSSRSPRASPPRPNHSGRRPSRFGTPSETHAAAHRRCTSRRWPKSASSTGTPPRRCMSRSSRFGASSVTRSAWRPRSRCSGVPSTGEGTCERRSRWRKKRRRSSGSSASAGSERCPPGTSGCSRPTAVNRWRRPATPRELARSAGRRRRGLAVQAGRWSRRHRRRLRRCDLRRGAARGGRRSAAPRRWHDLAIRPLALRTGHRRLPAPRSVTPLSMPRTRPVSVFHPTRSRQRQMR